MFKTNADFKLYEKQTAIKKITAFFIDVVITFIVGLLALIIATTPAIRATNKYKTNYGNLESSTSECYDYQCDAKLSIRVSELEILDDDSLFKEYAESNVLLSYTYHESEFNSIGVSFQTLDKKATYENDLLGYYYSTYKVNNNILTDDLQGKTGKEYFVSLINESVYSSYFELHEDALPSLTFEAAKSIQKYMTGELDSSTFYTNLNTFFTSMNHKALQELSSFEPYKQYYDLYLDSYNKICAQQAGALVLTYTIVFVLVIALPSVISGNGATFGRLLTRTRCTYKKKPILSKILDLLANYILLFNVVGFIGLLGFGLSCLTYPFLGQLNLIIITFITLLVMIADLIVTSFVPKNISLIELCSLETMVVIPKRTILEEIEDEKN